MPPREHHDCLSTKKPPPTRLSSHSERQIGGWFQPHRLYLPRGGRQVAANRPGGPEPWYVCIRIDQRSQPLAGLDGGAPRSESKSNDCRGQSHIDFIVGSTPLHCSVYWVVPFNPTGCNCYVAGGRLPPLRQNCNKYPKFNVSIAGFTSVKWENVVHYRRGGNLPPATFRYLSRTDLTVFPWMLRQLSIVNSKKLSTVNCQLPQSIPLPAASSMPSWPGRR